MDAHACFQLGSGPSLVTLASKESHRLTVKFIASQVKQHSHEVSIFACNRFQYHFGVHCHSIKGMQYRAKHAPFHTDLVLKMHDFRLIKVLQ